MIIYHQYKPLDHDSATVVYLLSIAERMLQCKAINQDEYNGLENLLNSPDPADHNIARLSMRTLQNERDWLTLYKKFIANENT